MMNAREVRSWPATQPVNADNCVFIRDGSSVSIGTLQSFSSFGLALFRFFLGMTPLAFVSAIACLGAQTWLIVAFAFLAIVGALELTAENAFTIDNARREIRVTKRYVGLISIVKRLGFDDYNAIGYNMQITEHRKAARVLALHGKQRVFMITITVSGETDVEFANNLVREVSSCAGWTDLGNLLEKHSH
jgi:hypothetical protein